MQRFIIFLLALMSVMIFADDRKILSYQVERDIKKKHIKIKIDEEMFRYKIIWGDTLTMIAKELDTDISKLARDNKIENVDKIYAGDNLDVEKKHSNYKEEIQEKK